MYNVKESVVKSVGKKWHFWFCEGSACGLAKKIKHEALGCRVGKKSAVKFICRPDVSIIFCLFNGCCVVCYACL